VFSRWSSAAVFLKTNCGVIRVGKVFFRILMINRVMKKPYKVGM
jgi:hypothetical protein